MNKINIKFNLNFIIFLLSIFVSYSWTNFYYDSTSNVDFSKYYDYLNYFFGLNVEIDYGQGLLYYFLISIVLKNNIEIINFSNLNIVISNSIGFVNLLLYLVGLIGLYRILLEKKFTRNSIYLSLTCLNFFPPMLLARSVMKPEILGFCFFMWVIYFFEKYLQSKKLIYLYSAIPLVVICINSKASIAAMVCLYLLFAYFRIIKTLDLKNFLILFLIFIISIFAIQFETFQVTENHIYERKYDSEYDNQASRLIILKIDILEVLKNPTWDNQEDRDFYNKNALSLWNIVILDTFGDYFDQLFGSQEFSKNRKNLFVGGEVELFNVNREIRYNGPFANYFLYELNYVRKMLAVIFSIIFYSYLLKTSLQNDKFFRFTALPFLVGISVLYLNSIGIPSNNFSPNKADTFKLFYLTFLLAISFVFLICIFSNKYYKFSYFFVLVFIASIFFIGGHPKNNSQQLSEKLVTWNEFSTLCELNNIIFFDNRIIDIFHKSGNENSLKSDCKNIKTSKTTLTKKFTNEPIDFYKKCLGTDGRISKEYSNYTECRIFTFNELRKYEEYKINYKPFISILFTLLSMIVVLISLFENKILKHKISFLKFKKLIFDKGNFDL